MERKGRLKTVISISRAFLQTYRKKLLITRRENLYLYADTKHLPNPEHKSALQDTTGPMYEM